MILEEKSMTRAGMFRRSRRCAVAGAVLASAVLLAAPQEAEAFCGFYVSGSGAQMFNDATQVVMMRLGTRTVLSIQNDYQGPPEAFALVVPVPVVLKEKDVKTLDKDVFARVEQMGAPRLVEYWEQDPCEPDPPMPPPTAVMMSASPADDGAPVKRSLGVVVEAQFTVGEYQIVILSAKDSTGLDTWLRQEKYQIPAGAEPLLRPYVETGSKFFVARVDPQKVKFDAQGRVALSPLRFHYDAEELSLPIRLGLAASRGTQDLIVSILAPGQRYEVANYPNITVPTNLDVRPEMRERFGEFYAALFDKTLEKHPGAVVTEYAWQATTCDPCPGPQLGPQDFQTLGADLLTGDAARAGGDDFVLTRLHARYGKDIKDDLVFRAAKAIAGGREWTRENGQLEQGAQDAPNNNFQARYAIRHEWTGPIKCAAPIRGRWGGPWPLVAQAQEGAGQVKGATNLAFARRGSLQLASAVRRDIPELGVKAGAPTTMAPAATTPAGTTTPATGSAAPPTAPAAKKSGCGCQGGQESGGVVLLGLGLLGVLGGKTRRKAKR
jgi:MYXO-CTERM domain-containing protein